MALTTNAYIFYYGIPILVFSIIATIAYKNNTKALEHRLLTASFLTYAIIFVFEWYRHLRPTEYSAFMTTWFNGLLMVIALSMTMHVCVILYEKHTKQAFPIAKWLLYVGVALQIIVALSPFAANVGDFTRDGIWIRRDAPIYELWISSFVILSSFFNLVVCILAYRKVVNHKKNSKQLFLYLSIIIPINSIAFYLLTPLIPRKYEPSIMSLYVMVILSLLLLYGMHKYHLFPQYIKRYIMMFDKSPVCKFIVDENYTITEVNAQTDAYFEKMPFIGRNLIELLKVTGNYEESLPYLQQLQQEKEITNLNISMKHYVTQEDVHLVVNASEIEENGDILYYFMFRDRTHEVEQEQKIRELAFYDNLTKLPNRTAFLNESELLFNSDLSGAILLIDLNDFKMVNDQYGHAAGDEILKCTGEVMYEVAKDKHLPARLGGDEFVMYVALDHLTQPLPVFIEELRTSLETKLVLYEGRQLYIKPSIGYAVKLAGMTFEELLHEADQQMYIEKQKIKGSR